MRLLRSMVIRRRRDVLEDRDGTLVVRRWGPRPGEVFEERYRREDAMALYRAVRGMTVSTKLLDRMVEEGRLKVPLRHRYGYKRYFELLDMLTILHALGLADMRVEGGEAVFSVLHGRSA